MHVRDFIKDEQFDLRDCNFVNLDISGISIIKLALFYTEDLGIKDVVYTNLENALLPDNVNLFQIIKNKSLEYVKLPPYDFSEFKFDNVELNHTIFKKNSILPNDANLLQKIKSKEIIYCTLPESDYSKYNFVGVNITGTNFPKNSKLPKDKNFLKNLKEKKIYGVKLPSGDYSHWDFSNIKVCCTKFSKGFIFPKDKDLFKKIYASSLSACLFVEQNLSEYDFSDVSIATSKFVKCELPLDRNLFINTIYGVSGCSFVDMDLSYLNLNNVDLEGVSFLGKTILPYDLELFQKVKDKNISNSKFPKGDYSNYNFNNISMNFTKFPFNSILPYDVNFFNSVKSANYMSLTQNMLQNIHLYDLSKAILDLKKYEKHITDFQKTILFNKYPDKIRNKELIL